MAYTPQTWADGEVGDTPITAARLNHIETGIADAATDAALTGLAMFGHLDDEDPHEDRLWSDNQLEAHRTDTTDVHGITDTSALVDSTELAAAIVAGAAENAVATTTSPLTYVSGWAEDGTTQNKWPVDAIGVASGYNFTPTNFKKFRRHLANARGGVADARVVCLGDSTTAGQGASSLQGAYPHQLAYLLNQFAPTTMAATPQASAFTPVDPRVSKGTGWTTSSGIGVMAAGSWTAPTSASGDLSITFPHEFDTIRVHFYRNTPNGTSQINVDGGANLGSGIVTAGAAALTSTTFTVTAGTHVINIKPPTVGSIFITAVEATMSTERRLQVWNEGRSGALTSTFISNTNVYDALPHLTYIAPALTIISLGINDAAASVDAGTYGSNLATIVSTASASGSVIVMTPPLSALPPGRPIEFTTFETAYVPSVYFVAGAFGAGLMDWQARLGAQAAAFTDGFYSDTVHPNAAGYGDIAMMIAAALAAV